MSSYWLILFILFNLVVSPAAKAAPFISLNPETGADYVSTVISSQTQIYEGFHLGGGAELGFRNMYKTFASSLEVVYWAWSVPGQSYSQHDFLYGLGFRFRRFFLKGGVCQVSVSNGLSGTTLNYSDYGYWGSLGYQLPLGQHFSFDIGARYANVLFKSADNSSLTSDLNFTAYTLFVSLDLDLWLAGPHSHHGDYETF